MVPFPPCLSPPPLPPRPRAFNVGRSVGIYPPLHLVFVHGFRGDHTSFQRFPTDLHHKLDGRIPSLESHVYPTYKSRKPLQYAVERLMDWMGTLEPGFIILIGHSLGGFVVAEAALQWNKEEKSQVIGFIAMDVPYLGVHPHVIISGIASLLPNENKAGSEQSMNDNGKVRIVKTSEAGGDSASPTLLPWQHPALSTGSSSVEDLPDLTPGPTALQQTVHFFQKHSQAPFSATKEWLVSHWEHGSMLLEPEQMRNRYQKMQAWDGGDWVNFYTETVPGAKREESKDQDRSLKVEHVAFPVAQPYSQKGLPSSPGPPESPPALVSTSSSHIGIATIHFPEPEEPEPFTPLCSDDPNSTGIRSFTISTSSMSDTLSTISQTSSPISQSSIASVSTRNIHSGTLEDQKWPDPPSIPDQTQIEQASTSDSISKAIPLFPEPRPPLDATQQKQHDQAVKSFLKGQENETKQAEKDAEKAKKAAKKAAEADEKARAKAAAKEEKARQKAEKEALRNRLKMTPEQRRAHEPPRRFIILPHESVDRSRWTRVPVAGVPSEVEAHTGIFFSEKNWDYQVFVSTVGDWVIDLCQKRGKEVLGF